MATITSSSLSRQKREVSESRGVNPERTVRLADADDLKLVEKQHISQREGVPAGSLALHIMGERLPFVISRGKAVLGRTDSSGQATAVDLSRYYARVLGVSREHAAIDFADGVWTVEDLNSTNGTWVNGNKLAAHQPHRLCNGDMIRLGQLTLFILVEIPRGNRKRPLRKWEGKRVGTDVRSHTVTHAVPSARVSLTTGFEMGPGVPSPLHAPTPLPAFVPGGAFHLAYTLAHARATSSPHHLQPALDL